MAVIVGVHAQGPVRRNAKGAIPWFYSEVEVLLTSYPVLLKKVFQGLLACRRSLILYHDEETTNLPSVLSGCPLWQSVQLEDRSGLLFQRRPF